MRFLKALFNRYPLFKGICGAMFLLSFSLHAQNNPSFVTTQTEKWADSVIKTLNPDERIGQLFMVAAYSDTTHNSNIADVTKLIQEQKIGGLIFFKGGPVRQAKLTNMYQSISKVP